MPPKIAPGSLTRFFNCSLLLVLTVQLPEVLFLLTEVVSILAPEFHTEVPSFNLRMSALASDRVAVGEPNCKVEGKTIP